MDIGSLTVLLLSKSHAIMLLDMSVVSMMNPSLHWKAGFPRLVLHPLCRRCSPQPPQWRVRVPDSWRRDLLRGLRAAAPVVSGIDMFISRLDPTTTEDQLIRHLQTRGFGQCAVEALVTKHGSYASFKVKIPVKKFKSFRMPSMWPEGVYVHKFYRAKSTTNNG